MEYGGEALARRAEPTICPLTAALRAGGVSRRPLFLARPMAVGAPHSEQEGQAAVDRQPGGRARLRGQVKSPCPGPATPHATEVVRVTAASCPASHWSLSLRRGLQGSATFVMQCGRSLIIASQAGPEPPITWRHLALAVRPHATAVSRFELYVNGRLSANVSFAGAVAAARRLQLGGGARGVLVRDLGVTELAGQPTASAEAEVASLYSAGPGGRCHEGRDRVEQHRQLTGSTPVSPSLASCRASRGRPLKAIDSGTGFSSHTCPGNIWPACPAREIMPLCPSPTFLGLPDTCCLLSQQSLTSAPSSAPTTLPTAVPTRVRGSMGCAYPQKDLA
jgi:hypothetical protein